MRILVTDSDTRSALAAVRALGRAGHEVITAGVRAASLAAVSRYSSAFEAYPDPAKDATGFVAALLDIVRRQRIEILLPMTEITTLLAAEFQEQLPAGCRLPFPTAEAVANAANKAHVVALAEQLGVPIPQTVVLNSASEATLCQPMLPYPIVIKPARSRVRVGSSWLSTGVRYAHSAEELHKTLQQLPPEIYPVLLQERIQGPGAGVFLCFDGQRPVAQFAHRRLREKPPSGGVSVLCESVPADPIAAEHAARLLARLGWRGVAMVEFKQDQRDGSLRLMEINGRFWGSLQLAIDAGVNFPVLAVELCTGTAPATPQTYRVGVKSRWLGGDLDALLLTMLRSRARLNLPPAHPSRWRTLVEFMHIWGRNLNYEMERSDDMQPAWLEWRRRLGLSK